MTVAREATISRHSSPSNFISDLDSLTHYLDIVA